MKRITRELRTAAVSTLLLLALPAAAAAGVGTWKTFTAKRDVAGAVLDPGRRAIWAATSGGLFAFSLADSSFRQYTTSDGLKTIALTSVAIDTGAGVWIGTENGILHRYDPKTGSWEYVLDLNIRNDARKRINALRVLGDTLMIMSDIGLSLYSLSRGEFIATFERFGQSPGQLTGAVTSALMFSQRLWVGTRSGIASTPLSNPNPSVPESWQVDHAAAGGLPSDTITGLASAGGLLFAATANGLAERDSAWHLVQHTDGIGIVDIAPRVPGPSDSSMLTFISPNGLWRVGFSAPGVLSVTGPAGGFPSPLTAIVSDGILGTSSEGIITGGDPAWTRHIPPGPPTNKFVGLAVDQRGVLWAGTGSDPGGEGFMSFDGSRWRAYVKSDDPRLGSNNFYKVSIGSRDTKWIGNWGAGLARVNDAGTVEQVLNTTNGLVPSQSPVEDPGQRYVVAGGVATDDEGRAWITTRTPAGDTALITVAPDNSIHYVKGLITRNPVITLYDVVIDFAGTKWFADISRFEPFVPGRQTGLYYYNERFVLTGGTGNWGRLVQQDGLTSENVYSLALDRDGSLWVGTDEGVNIIFDPGHPRGHILPYHPLSDQLIQAILVDPLNNKWLATRTQGVFLYSPDGTSIIDSFTVGNTGGKLLDNDVAAMAIDRSTGMMYFGTEKGLSVLSTFAVAPAETFGSLTVSPNPFYLPSTSSLLVGGLVQNSTLKILRIDGSLVREIVTPGGGVGYWDGRDERGNLASSGVYLIVAYSEDGSEAASGKVAVIRR